MINKGILIEANHPGQVHLIRHAYHELIAKNYKIKVITKEDRIINYLLDVYSIPYIKLGKKGKGKFGKLFKQLIFNLKAYRIVRKNKLTLGLGSSMTNDHISAIRKSFKAIHLSDDDEEMVPLITKFSYPYTDVILAPDCITFNKFNSKVEGYSGYHELAYLHPNRFKPDISILKKAGIKEGEKFFILRFVALIGHHDAGHEGISLEQKRKLIQLLLPYGKVFITSEKEIESEFEQYRLPVAPEDIHSLMYFAHLFLGDSQTMTSEAAILGTPALKCNTFAGKLAVPNELENKYQLCYSYQPNDFNAFYKHTQELLEIDNIKEIWRKRVETLLSDKIDVTEFIVNYIDSFTPSKIAK